MRLACLGLSCATIGCIVLWAAAWVALSSARPPGGPLAGTDEGAGPMRLAPLPVPRPGLAADPPLRPNAASTPGKPATLATSPVRTGHEVGSSLRGPHPPHATSLDHYDAAFELARRVGDFVSYPAVRGLPGTNGGGPLVFLSITCTTLRGEEVTWPGAESLVVRRDRDPVDKGVYLEVGAALPAAPTPGDAAPGDAALDLASAECRLFYSVEAAR